MMHYWYGPGFGLGFGLLGGLIPLLFWIIIIWLIYRLLTRHGHTLTRHPEDPLEVAKLRYAKGEITKSELDEIKQNLKD